LDDARIVSPLEPDNRIELQLYYHLGRPDHLDLDDSIVHHALPVDQLSIPHNAPFLQHLLALPQLPLIISSAPTTPLQSLRSGIPTFSTQEEEETRVLGPVEGGQVGIVDVDSEEEGREEVFEPLEEHKVVRGKGRE
jgi:hypothetical protein